VVGQWFRGAYLRGTAVVVVVISVLAVAVRALLRPGRKSRPAGEDRALIDLSEDELEEKIRAEAHGIVGFCYSDLVAELDRRSRNRYARSAFIISALGLVIAVVALVVTAVRA